MIGCRATDPQARSRRLGWFPGIPHERVTRRAPRWRCAPGACALLTATVLLLAAAAVRPAPAQAEPIVVREWMRALYVVASLDTHPGEAPVVLLLGGSAARECTVSEESWAAQVEALGGPPVTVYNLSSRNQSFAQDLHLVRSLPRGRTLVFIGGNPYRFCASPNAEFVADTAPYDRKPSHRYSSDRILSDERKEEIAANWMPQLYGKFSELLEFNVAMLEEIVKWCLERELSPVMLDLPRNVPVVGDHLDVPVAEYSTACLGLASRYHIPFISFVDDIAWQSSDFYDQAHLVEPGRAKWQARLAATTVDQLRRSGLAIVDGRSAVALGEAAEWTVSPWSALPTFLPLGLSAQE